MNILSPTKSEYLTITEYLKMMSDKSLNTQIIKTCYHINKDWSSGDTGRFFVEYNHPVLREKIL